MDVYLDTMRWNNLKDAYREIAEVQRFAAELQKREAEARALNALADALKEHGDPEQYAACRAAIAALFEETMEEIGANLDDVEAES